MRKTRFPKRAKLITDGGFYQIINIKGFIPQISIPLLKRISLASPETGVIDLSVDFTVSFGFERATKKLAIYRQNGVVNIVK
jgi:hypothetical protein